MVKINFQKAQFLLSVAQLNQLPPDQGVEVAIVGRSNSGKSSVLNQLTQNKKLARVSKTPGRTQHINLFALDESRRLADLPGYGFAKVPLELKQRWQKTMSTYLYTRECLKGLILVMDIRHPLKESDRELLLWSNSCNLPVHILLNKMDKLSPSNIKKTSHEVTRAISQFQNEITVQPFSASKGIGLDELKEILNKWFNN